MKRSFAAQSTRLAAVCKSLTAGIFVLLSGCDLAQSSKEVAAEGTLDQRGESSGDSQAAADALSLTVPAVPSADGPKIATAWVRIARIPAHHKQEVGGHPGAGLARSAGPEEECMVLPPGPAPLPVEMEPPGPPPPSSGRELLGPPPSAGGQDRPDKPMRLSGDTPVASEDSPIALPSDREPDDVRGYPPSRGGRGWAPVMEMSVPYQPGQRLGPFALRGGPHVVVLELRDAEQKAVWRGSSVFVVRPGQIIKVELVMNRARDCAGVGAVEIVPILSDEAVADDSHDENPTVGSPPPPPNPPVRSSYCEIQARMMRPAPVCVSGGGSCSFAADRPYLMTSECSSEDARWKLIDKLCAEKFPLTADRVAQFVCRP